MIAYRLSTLELRSIIESAFLPSRCICTVGADNSLTVQISDPHSGRVDLLVAGISLERLNTSRDICDLVTELRYDLANNVQLYSHAKAG
ncbi:MAG: DUF1652 domain-containing protein [Pseudomonas sp.]